MAGLPHPAQLKTGNAFVTSLEGKEDAILPFPLQNALTRPMRTAAGKRANTDYLSLWAGIGTHSA